MDMPSALRHRCVFSEMRRDISGCSRSDLHRVPIDGGAGTSANPKRRFLITRGLEQ